MSAQEEVLEPGTEETPEEAVNPLDISDDDFNNLPVPGAELEGTETDEEELPKETAEEGAEEDPETQETPETDEEPPVEEPERDVFAGGNEKKEPDTKPEVAAAAEDTTDTSDVNYEAEYKKLLTPFRANGKEIQIASVDEAITLMQMGANYNKKMAGLKPSLKMLKMLENNDLLDEEKLSYLIDLSKKEPGAINKLIKDSGIDPLEVDQEAQTDYKPGTYTVSDSEVDLDTVLGDIRDTPSYPETIDIVSNKLDEASKKAIFAAPAVLRDINNHVASGIYKEVMGIVEKERMLGRLTDLSDLDAYRHVGSVLQAQGAFNKAPPKATEKPTASAKKQQDPSIKQRKKAASPTKAAPGTPKQVADYNPLALSDEEFEKIAGSPY